LIKVRPEHQRGTGGVQFILLTKERKESMRKTTIRMTVTGVLFAAFSSMGAVIAYDNFEYTLGTTIAAGGTLGDANTNGFLNAWKFTGHSGEVVRGLEFNGVAFSGNALRITRNAGGSVFRGLSSPVSGTYYQSMIFYRNDTNESGSENWRWELKHSAAHAQIDSSSTKYSIGATSDEKANIVMGSTSASGTAQYSMGSPVFMLSKVEISDTGAETVSMKFYNSGDPLPRSDSAIVWDAVHTGEFTAGSGWKLILPSNIPNMTIDEFRMGTELIDVIPEAMTVG